MEENSKCFLLGLGLASLLGFGYNLIPRGDRSVQLVGNSTYLNFNYKGDEPVNLLDKDSRQTSLVDLKRKDEGAVYGFIHPTLKLPVEYQTTKDSQRLVEDLTMKMYKKGMPQCGLEYIPDWFVDYDKNHDRIMQPEEIKSWETDILAKMRSK